MVGAPDVFDDVAQIKIEDFGHVDTFDAFGMMLVVCGVFHFSIVVDFLDLDDGSVIFKSVDR